MSKDRIIDVVLSKREYDVLEALSVIEDMPLQHLVRRAIATHAKNRITQPDFIDKAKTYGHKLEADRHRLLSSLGLGDDEDETDTTIDAEYRQ